MLCKVTRMFRAQSEALHDEPQPCPSKLSAQTKSSPFPFFFSTHALDIAKMPPSPSRNRSRSRSPPRKPKSSGGFRWKDKGSRANDSFSRDFDERNRDDAPRRSSPPRDRDRYRDRSPRRDGNRDSYRPRSPRRDDRDRYRDGGDRRRSPRRDGGRDERKEKRKEDKPKSDKEKEKKPKPVAAPSRAEPMIIVNVNDRLGTKAAIPCLGSDPVSKCCLCLNVDLSKC